MWRWALATALFPAFVGFRTVKWLLDPSPTNQRPTEATGGRSSGWFLPPDVLDMPYERLDGTVAVLERVDVATTIETRLPSTKAETQKLLRRFGYTGLKIDAIVQPEPRGDVQEARVYALTGNILQADRRFVRQAVTIVFTFTDDEVRAEQLDGWVV